MTLEDLGNIGDFVGGMAVVATLVYVAVQVTQNNRLLRANTATVRAASTTAITERLVSLNQTLVEDPSFVDIFVRELSTPGSIVGTERVRFDSFLQGVFISHENVLKMVRSGTIESEDWEPWSRHLQTWLKNPAVRSWWVRQDTPFGSDFKAHVQGLLDTKSSTIAAQQDDEDRREIAG